MNIIGISTFRYLNIIDKARKDAIYNTQLQSHYFSLDVIDQPSLRLRKYAGDG